MSTLTDVRTLANELREFGEIPLLVTQGELNEFIKQFETPPTIAPEILPGTTPATVSESTYEKYRKNLAIGTTSTYAYNNQPVILARMKQAKTCEFILRSIKKKIIDSGIVGSNKELLDAQLYLAHDIETVKKDIARFEQHKDPTSEQIMRVSMCAYECGKQRPQSLRYIPSVGMTTQQVRKNFDSISIDVDYDVNYGVFLVELSVFGDGTFLGNPALGFDYGTKVPPYNAR